MLNSSLTLQLAVVVALGSCQGIGSQVPMGKGYTQPIKLMSVELHAARQLLGND